MKENIIRGKRIIWIDAFKGIGILAVILGHIKGFPPSIYRFVYTFHMPLFFLLSGYMMRSSFSFGDWFEYVIKISKRLLIPYIVFLPSLNYCTGSPYTLRDLLYGGWGLMGGGRNCMVCDSSMDKLICFFVSFINEND